ncbi:hypothetical protein CDAR_419091 [Caerostris darwini]|uniref:Uncharacterized protein n=1 Tax=Caerostris darwini TaxID=1538125 RepID=A0AAV4MVL7_9ARAC|nr:hypothetical protein CDAR_419091 [Caerostris darwini]
MEGSVRKECHYKETIKTLQMKIDLLSTSLNDFQQIQGRHQGKLDYKDNKFNSSSIIRNLQRELEKLKLENDSLFSQLQKVKINQELQKNSYTITASKVTKYAGKKILENPQLHLECNDITAKNPNMSSNFTIKKKLAKGDPIECALKCSPLNL